MADDKLPEPPTKIGFSGTRNGMTPAQEESLRIYLSKICVREFHHGDCIGADAQSHAIIRKMKPSAYIHCRPCSIPNMRAYCKGDAIHKEQSPLDRNRMIVEACEVLLAAPSGTEQQRSGTWSTVRRARKLGRPIAIFMPEGEVLYEQLPTPDGFPSPPWRIFAIARGHHYPAWWEYQKNDGCFYEWDGNYLTPAEPEELDIHAHPHNDAHAVRIIEEARKKDAQEPRNG